MKKIYKLENLDCAVCAKKIEDAVSRLESVTSVQVDFINQRLTLTADSAALESISAEIRGICRRIEPDCRLVEPDTEGKAQGHGARLLRICAAGLLFILVLLLPAEGSLKLLCYLVPYLVIGYDILLRALGNIRRGQIFDENFLMTLATVGAFCIGEYPEAVAVMLFYQVGELFQDYAVARSRKSIAGLLNLCPETANLEQNGTVVQVAPEAVDVGAVIVVRPGEKIPLDGRVIEGSSTLDTAALTGESLPRSVTAGDEVLSGCVNQSGLLRIQVTKPFAESTVSKILELVENAGSKKAKTENFITRFARYYTPCVVLGALLLWLVPPLVVGGSFGSWLSRALIFLVVSCPCALVISVPLSFFGGIGGASRRGILIKGGNYLEALARPETVVFDKTGTLTRGEFSVTALHPAADVTEEQLLELAALAESFSAHPIARSILRACGKEADMSRVTDMREQAGKGVCAVVDGRQVLAGNSAFMADSGIACPADSTTGTTVHLAANGQYAGYLVVSDTVKPDAKQAIADLKALGVRRCVMLTGDTPAAAGAVADSLGIDTVYAGLLPADKVSRAEALMAEGGRLVFVGDGMNDAPVLSRADVGIAMGAMGQDAAIEAADVVLMDDAPEKIPLAVSIARKTMSIVRQNIAFALGVKAIVLILGALGRTSMWIAVFADVGVAVLAILNAMRALRQ